jgi:hypothetical protein
MISLASATTVDPEGYADYIEGRANRQRGHSRRPFGVIIGRGAFENKAIRKRTASLGDPRDADGWYA